MMQDKDENSEVPPKKKRKAAPKKKINTISSDQIKSLLREALSKNITERVMREQLDTDAMIATVEEFLRSFIIIGYNMSNDPVIITNAKTQLDADALYTSLTRLFISMNNSGYQ